MHTSEPSVAPDRISGPAAPGAPESVPTAPASRPAASTATDHRRTRLLPYIVESRDRTINAIILLAGVAVVVLLLSPSARALVSGHDALWAQLLRAAASHVKITAGIALSFAGSVVWRRVSGRSGGER